MKKREQQNPRRSDRHMPRFLADVNVEKGIVDFLVAQGFDVKWVPDYDCEMSDEKLLGIAAREKRIFITNDRDFGELIFFQKRVAHGIILIRVKGQKCEEKLKLLKILMKKHDEKLPGSFVIITSRKFRFIRMEAAV